MLDTNAGQFKVGDVVYWSSQANASRTTKRGRVVLVVRADYSLRAELPGNYFGTHSTEAIATSLQEGTRRNHESYLVEVETKGRKPRLYWPRVSALRKVQRPASGPSDEVEQLKRLAAAAVRWNDAIERLDGILDAEKALRAEVRALKSGASNEHQ